MAVEIISLSIAMDWDSDLQPLDLQSDALPTALGTAAQDQDQDSLLNAETTITHQEKWLKCKDRDVHRCIRKFEPLHDKTNKMTMHPAKTQISLGIRPV